VKQKKTNKNLDFKFAPHFTEFLYIPFCNLLYRNTLSVFLILIDGKEEQLCNSTLHCPFTEPGRSLAGVCNNAEYIFSASSVSLGDSFKPLLAFQTINAMLALV